MLSAHEQQTLCRLLERLADYMSDIGCDEFKLTDTPYNRELVTQALYHSWSLKNAEKEVASLKLRPVSKTPLRVSGNLILIYLIDKMKDMFDELLRKTKRNWAIYGGDNSAWTLIAVDDEQVSHILTQGESLRTIVFGITYEEASKIYDKVLETFCERKGEEGATDDERTT